MTDSETSRTLAEQIAHMRNQHSSTPQDDRKRCPNCDSMTLNPKSAATGGVRSGDERARYYCMSCKSHIVRPVVGGDSTALETTQD